MTDAPSIVTADGSHTAAIADLIAEAFTPLDVAAWLVDDPAARADILRADFRILIAHALAYGTVHITTPQLTAAAVWYPRDDGAPPPPVDYEARLAAACGPYTDRFRALDAAFDAHHPDRPHHHLALLAVHPGHQNKGLGGALLAHHHRHLDRIGVATYLEASSPRARGLYGRHGYEAGEAFRLPDGGPPVWPMWRNPAPPSQA